MIQALPYPQFAYFLNTVCFFKFHAYLKVGMANEKWKECTEITAFYTNAYKNAIKLVYKQ